MDFWIGCYKALFPRLHLNVIFNEDTIAMKQNIKRLETVFCGLLDQPKVVCERPLSI